MQNVGKDWEGKQQGHMGVSVSLVLGLSQERSLRVLAGFQSLIAAWKSRLLACRLLRLKVLASVLGLLKRQGLSLLVVPAEDQLAR